MNAVAAVKFLAQGIVEDHTKAGRLPELIQALKNKPKKLKGQLEAGLKAVTVDRLLKEVKVSAPSHTIVHMVEYDPDDIAGKTIAELQKQFAKELAALT